MDPDPEQNSGSKVTNSNPIPTPLNVRWRRLQYQLIPVLTVVLLSAAAWRLWLEAPQASGVGQVNSETADARSPAAGMLADLPRGQRVAALDTVVAGQVVARVQQQGAQPVDITAPIAGQIIKIHARPGSSVNAGQTVLTIAADRGKFVTTYLRAEERVQPEPGTPVELRLRSDPARSYQTWVERVGAQYEPIPPAYLRDRKSEEWGLPVIIAAPPEAALRPGELVYVAWHGVTSAVSRSGGAAGEGQ